PGAAFATGPATLAVAEAPAASDAPAATVCDPFAAAVVSQLCVYGGELFALPRFVPSSLNCTDATPTSSDADAVTVMLAETLAPGDGEVIETVGGVVSDAALATVTVTGA